jgi:REP element-mobilizing transposase RayT
MGKRASWFDDQRAVQAFLNARDVARPRRHNHRLSMERYALAEGEFFFTLCARHQGQLFRDAELARRVIETLLGLRERYGWRLLCYCLMPDHLHFIAQLTESLGQVYNAGARGDTPYGIQEEVGAFKSFTTTQIWWKLGGEGQLWQESSYDKVIKRGESVEEAVYYVLNNPTRKGLVEFWQEYPYAGIVDEW